MVHESWTRLFVSMSKTYLVNCNILFSRQDFRFHQQILNMTKIFELENTVGATRDCHK